MAKILLTTIYLLFAILLVVIGGFLAANGIPQWGWFLFVGMIMGIISAVQIYNL